jgi:hypothetical protein
MPPAYSWPLLPGFCRFHFIYYHVHFIRKILFIPGVKRLPRINYKNVLLSWRRLFDSRWRHRLKALLQDVVIAYADVKEYINNVYSLLISLVLPYY